MHSGIREIISAFSPSVLKQLDDALKLRVTNFERDLFPSLKDIDMQIPGAGFQYVIWVNHNPKYPFPGWEFDPITRPMRYIPDFLASGMSFINIARAVARDSGGHVEECLKAFCASLNLPVYGYQSMPIGRLATQPAIINSLGNDLTRSLSIYTDVLVNKAKHDYGLGSPEPVISFPDALGGYFASRIFGFQILKTGGILDKYIEAIRSAYSRGIVYTMPSGAYSEDDGNAWPLQTDISTLEENSSD